MAVFIFPVGCLAYGENPLQRMESILEWCIIERGRQLYNDDQQLAIDLATRKWNAASGQRGEYEVTDPDWVKFWAGCKDLEISGGGQEKSYKEWKDLRYFLSREELKLGSMNTRIGGNLFWEFVHAMRAGDVPRISYERLSVLLAVNACLSGKTEPYILTRSRLMAMSLGYSKAGALFDDQDKIHKDGLKLLKSRKDGATVRTVRQIRLDLDFLEANGFFSRIVVNRCKTAFYSTEKVTHEDAKKWAKSRVFGVAAKLAKIRETQRGEME